jgi:uncharacterized membrane protein
MVQSGVLSSRFSCCPQAAGELQQAQERQARTAAAVEALERRLEAAVSLLPAADAAIAGAQGAHLSLRKRDPQQQARGCGTGCLAVHAVHLIPDVWRVV